MAKTLERDVLDALTHGSVSLPVWHLAPCDRWRLLRDTLLGHVPVRGGMRPRDLPLDPAARELVQTATAIQSCEYQVGGEVQARFGDWLYLFSALVEPKCEDDAIAHAAVHECIRELRQALGLGELDDFADKSPFHHRLLGVLGLSRQEWKRLTKSKTNFDRQRQVARLGARVCAAWRTATPEDLEKHGGDVRAWAVAATGANHRQGGGLRSGGGRGGGKGRQQYIHRAKTHWMMRGASVWCAQSLAFARDRIIAKHQPLLLSDTDALVSFVFPAVSATAEAILRDIERAYRDAHSFGERFPRLASYHPGLAEDRHEGSDSLTSMPRLSVWRHPATSLLDLCVARIDRNSATEARIGGNTAGQRSSQAQPTACSFVEGEPACLSQSPAWLENRGPRRPEHYGWSALCWSLSGTTLRTHWHHGICAELNRQDYAMMAVSHGAWLEKLKMKEEPLTFVKLDGDDVGDQFLQTPIPSRPVLGLKLGRLVMARVMAATKQVIEIHDRHDRPKYLPVDLVYFGGDDIFFCLPHCYLEAFLRGFGKPPAELGQDETDPWDQNPFRYLAISLPPGSEFTDGDTLDRSERFRIANLVAAQTLAPGLRGLAKPQRRDDAVLETLNAGIADRGYRCEWAPTITDTGIVHGFSLNLVHVAPRPAESA